MNYEDFSGYLENELPLNRKERFYTGTVFPSLLFHKGLSTFYDFLKSLRGFPEEINETNTGDNFLFYTEYNLKESAGLRNVGEKIETATKDTPDCIIEFLTHNPGKLKLFVVIEAKMFSKVSPAGLKRQMSAQQKAVISVLKSKYKLTDQQILHIALVPKALGITECGDYQVVYWDFFTEEKMFSKLQDNRFFNYLKFALDHYGELVQKGGTGMPTTCEGYLSGEEIYRKAKQGEILWIGRRGGKKTFLADIQTNKWRSRQYCFNSRKPDRGMPGQWINSNEFIKMIDTVV